VKQKIAVTGIAIVLTTFMSRANAQEAAAPTAEASAAEPATEAAAAVSEVVSTKSSGGGSIDHMTLPAGHILITADLGINISKGAAGKPISLSPDVWYGASDKLSLGLVHSSRGAYGLVGGVGKPLCLSGKNSGCAKFYNNVGFDARYQIKESVGGGLGLVLDGGVLVNSLDPFTVALKLGAIAHYRKNKIAVDIAPAITIGINQRSAGNKEFLSLPISLQYGLSSRVSVSGQTGLVVPFSNAGDTYQVPLSLGGSYALSANAFLSAAFTLPTLVGGGKLATGVDARSFTIGGGYAL
jgi:hypothetical protein